MRILVVLLISLMAAPEANATMRRLTAIEIEKQLTGNTVFFNAGGVTQRQFFEAGGITVFEDGAQKIDLGQWRVTPDHKLCTKWKSLGWSCYELALSGSQVVWYGPITGYSGIPQSVYSKLLAGNKTNHYRQRYNPHAPANLLPSLARMMMGEGIPGLFY